MKLYDYIKPEIVVTSIVESYSILETSGKQDPGTIDAKEASFEEENETGIPDQYTSIWGDEAEED